MDIIIILVFIILLLIVVYIIKYNYKKLETSFEKIVYILMSATIIAFAFIIASLYYLDRYNVPSHFEWSKNINTQNWLSILATLFITILAQIISGIILISVTMKQIEKNNEDNYKRDREQQRINNQPLLSYRFEMQRNVSYESNYLHPRSEKKGYGYNKLYFSIRNIGMNSVRNCYIQISSSTLELNDTYSLGMQGTLSRDEEKGIEFNIPVWDGKHKIEMIVFYEDLIHNWYCQKISFDYNVFQYKVNNDVIYNIEEENFIQKPILEVKK